MRTVGITKSLLYWYYIPFFKPLFEELGFEVVISGDTNKDIMNKGVIHSVPELCAPVKINSGHVVELIEKKVDFIFVPRFVSINKYEVFCPKFMGLPDLTLHSVPEIGDRMLTFKIDVKNENIGDHRCYSELSEKLGIGKAEMKSAVSKAYRIWNVSRTQSKKGINLNKVISGNRLPDGKDAYDINIGLMGYVYNIYDSYLSMDITDKLEKMGIGYTTFEMVEDEKIYSQTEKMDKSLFWTFSNKVLGAGLHLLQEKNIDGLVHITAFGCGPDSFLGKLFEIESEKVGIPFLTIRVDEHSGENHLVTRIEAFADMLKRKKAGVYL